MKTSTKWIIAIAAALALIVGGALAALAAFQPTSVTTTGEPSGSQDPVPVPTTVPTAHLQDGTLVGWVTVNPTAPNDLTVDEVEILTGQAAHDAAVEAGVIADDEDLPDDMFIANPDPTTFRVSLGAGASIEMVSGDTPGTYVAVTADELAALVAGSYTGAPIYGVVEGEPILMTITVEGGSAATLQAVYLP